MKVAVFLCFMLGSIISNAQVVLSSGEQQSITCQSGSYVDIQSKSLRQISVGCVVGCVFTLKTINQMGYTRYCHQTVFPSGMIADTCGSPVTTRTAAISKAQGEADRRIAEGTCDKAIFSNF
jgi:hypothetical protein